MKKKVKKIDATALLSNIMTNELKKPFLGLKDPSINYEGIHKKLW